MGLTGALTARDDHLRRMETLLRPGARRGGLVLIGAAGTGKTRLLREAYGVARRHGMRTTWAVGSATSADLTLGAFVGLIEPDALSSAAALGRAVQALAPEGGRALVCVDDAHLLDHGSALLVQRLVVSRAAVVMMSARDGIQVPEPVLSAWKDRWLERMEVLPFTQRETRTMLEATLGGPVHGETAARLWQLTAGNPLYLRLLVLEARRSGALVQSAGWWRWAGVISVGSGLADVVRSHLGHATGEVSDVVDLLAMSEPLSLVALERCVSGDGIAAAEQAGLVTVDTSATAQLQVRLAHPLLGEVRRAETGVLAQRRLRGRVAAAMAQPGSGHEGELLRRADLMAGSDLPPDTELLTAAMGVAAAHSNAPLALRLARAAVAAGAGFQAQAVIAMAVTPVEGPAATRAELDRLTIAASDDPERATAAVLFAIHLAYVETEPQRARERLSDAMRTVRDPTCQQRLTALDSLVQCHLGEPHLATGRVRPLLPSPDPDTAVSAAVAAAFCDAVTGRANLLEGDVAVGVGVTSPLMSGLLVLPMLVAQGLGYRLAGMLEQDAAVTRLLGELAEGLPIGSGGAASMVGWTALVAGRIREALDALRDARVGLEPFGAYGGWAYVNAIGLLQAAALAGDRDLLDEAERHLASSAHATMRIMEPAALLARAAAAGTRGAVSEATMLATDAADLARSRSQLADEVVARQRLVGLGEHGQAGRLRELAGAVVGPRVDAAYAHAVAWDGHDGAGLLDASQRYERLGDLVAAAEAAAQSYQVFGTGAGHDTERRRAQHRAAQLRERCDGARTPMLDAFAQPLPLSPREREVVALVAEGLSNSQIADRLVMSVRTVEGHCHRAATKLGVARSEFAEVLGRPVSP